MYGFPRLRRPRPSEKSVSFRRPKVFTGIPVYLLVIAGCGGKVRIDSTSTGSTGGTNDPMGISTTTGGATTGGTMMDGTMTGGTTTGGTTTGSAGNREIDSSVADPCPGMSRCTQPSCVGLGATCGARGNGDCCAANLVPGGTYNRSDDGNHPAVVSDFRLDNYEVTVGRFRNFVAVYSQTMTPAGAGKNPNDASDPGWEIAWNASLPPNYAMLSKASCGPFGTWTDIPRNNESLPMNCISWFEAYAFCIWDGARLPTEAEWNYAAAGGNEQRPYPWGATMPDANANLAVYGCYYNSGNLGGCTSATNIAPVGRVSAGEGKWGQSDLAGNVWEWTEDWYAGPYADPCHDCSNTTTATDRVLRGGGFSNDVSALLSSNRNHTSPSSSLTYYGVRCARSAR